MSITYIRDIHLSLSVSLHLRTVHEQFIFVSNHGNITDAAERKPPTEGSGVDVIRREVQPSLNNSIIILIGTIQDVHGPLLIINININAEREGIFHRLVETPELPSAMAQMTMAPLNGGDTANQRVYCGKYNDKNRDIPSNTVQGSMDYLRSINGAPRNGPGPGNCGPS